MVEDNIRYSRQQSLVEVGAGGQAQLMAARVLLIGMGGLGNPAAMYLAAAGIGRLILNDFDTVDASNLPRQILFRDADIGQPKAAVAAERLTAMNPDIKVIGLHSRLDAAALTTQIAAVDLVLDCTDNFNSRQNINELCVQENTALVSGAAIRTEGQLSVFRHDLGGGPCYRCLYSDADENLHDCAGQGVLGPVAGLIGCMMATETLKYLLNIESGLDGHLWAYDAKTGNNRLLKIPVAANCPVCRLR